MAQSHRSPLFQFVWYHVPPILVAVTILTLSSIPNLHGPQIEAAGIDKVAHFTEYAIFAWFLTRSLGRVAPSRKRGLIFLASLAFLVLFACGDEFLQSFVPGRDSSGFDVLADASGASFALFLAYRSTKRNQS